MTSCAEADGGQGPVAEIVVFGGGGRLGCRVAAEASSRGHRVIGVVRGVTSVPVGEDVEVATGDVTDLGAVHRLAGSADVLVATVGAPDKSVYLPAARTLVAAVRQLNEPRPRVIHSGGGGSLLDAHGTRFVDTPGFPETLRPEVLGQAAALDYYRTISDVDWVYLSPPPGNFEPGTRTGHHGTRDDHPVADAQGRFGISYEDDAIALVDGIDHPRHHRERFTVGSVGEGR